MTHGIGDIPWANATIRRFRWLLIGVAVLFLATEILAISGWTPPLEPLSLPEVTSNILFAIGFGCPLVLHLSSLPGWREIGITLAIGAVYSAMLGAAQTLAAPQIVTGLGLASLSVLGWRAWRHQGLVRTKALLFLLPACVSLLFTLEAGIHFKLISAVFAETFDAAACAADGSFGGQVAFAVGRVFETVPWLAGVCFIIYHAPPPSLVFVYALQVRSRRPPPVDVVTVILAVAVIGYLLYFLYPVAGPLVAYPLEFPNVSPDPSDLSTYRLAVPFNQPNGKPAPRNSMPSLHFASVLVAYWHARPYGWLARIVAAIFLVGTFLATLGLGEHYFIDLVVAFPFTLFIQSLCTPARPALRHAKYAALTGSVFLLIIWYSVLFAGIAVLQWSPAIPWVLTAITAAAVWWLERRLFRAGQSEPHESDRSNPGSKAPSPPGTLLGGHLEEFRCDVLNLLVNSRREHGDLVRFRLGPHIVHLVAHPEQIKQVLVNNQHNYNKDTRSSAKIRGLTGECLLTSSGDFWLQQRRAIQPAFHAQRLAPFVGPMADATAAMLRTWTAAPRDKPIDFASETMRLTYTIVARALFGAEAADDLATIERAAQTVMTHTYSRLEQIIDIPLWLPTPGNRRFHHALNEIDRIVDRILSAQTDRESPHHNLLSILLQRRDQPAGQGMSKQQVRNETIALLLAGHETTANALTWTFHLLGKHPDIAEQARAEAIRVLAGRTPTFADLPHLPYTTMVFQEAMRLYPPIWIMERHVLDDDTIAGCRIPAGSTVVISPYVTHRHPDFWNRPDDFDPERFAPQNAAARVPFSYIPFGGGQRLCIGKDLAMMEAQVILPMVLQAFALKAAPGHPIEPEPGITLRTRSGLPMIISPRTSATI